MLFCIFIIQFPRHRTRTGWLKSTNPCGVVQPLALGILQSPCSASACFSACSLLMYFLPQPAGHNVLGMVSPYAAAPAGGTSAGGLPAFARMSSKTAMRALWDFGEYDANCEVSLAFNLTHSSMRSGDARKAAM